MYVVAPTVPASVETDIGVVNSQHSSAEWFCAFVTSAVVVKKVELDACAHTTPSVVNSMMRECMLSVLCDLYDECGAADTQWLAE